MRVQDECRRASRYALLRRFLTVRMTLGSTLSSMTAVSPRARASVTGSALTAVRVTGTTRVVSSSTMTSGLLLRRFLALPALSLLFLVLLVFFGISPPQCSVANAHAGCQPFARAALGDRLTGLD